jgi:predicted MPP superfamily phosphohydrolase
MRILILQLSDIHIRSPKGTNPILGRCEHIIRALSSVTSECQFCFVAVSGDIAFSGKREEYSIAREFFKELEKNIHEILNGSKVFFIFVPGNHDCDFSLQNNLRELVLQSQTTKIFDDSLLETCLQVQDPFEEFLSSWESLSINRKPSERSYSVRRILIEDKKIEFRLINSALLSTLHEQQGSLFFPPVFAPLDSSESSDSNIILTILHHPYNWFESTNARKIWEILETTSDFILTGHEHEGQSFIKSKSNEQKVEYIEGGVLQDNQDQFNSSFNVLFIDLDHQTQRLHQFCWRKNNRYEEINQSTSVPLIRNSYRLRNQYQLDPNFDQFLSDTGAHFTHSMKEQLLLNDIFIYPHLRIINSPADNETSSSKILQNNLPGFIEDHERVIFIGPEKSGKTSLLKVLFLDLRRRGFVPILLNGENLKKPDESYIISALEKAFENQYKTPVVTAYNQLEQEKRAILIDDFQKSPVNSRGRDLIIKVFEDHARIVIAVGDENIRFEDLIDRKADDLRLWNYITGLIMPFGHEKRFEFVKKWVFIGRTLIDDEHELMKQVAVAERIVSEIVGKNLAPSYPIFILGILQQFEAQTPIRATMVSGSHGFIYETFLTISLTKASKLKIDLDTQYGYLSEFAYYLFSSGIRAITDSQAYDWHQEYCKAYSRRLDYKEMISILIDAGVLAIQNGKTSFRYPYIFYYFLGRYFRDHLSEDEIRNHINAMSHRLHHEESANVLMFLSYLSKDPIILSSIIKSSQELFSTYEECDVEKHTVFLQNLIEDLPKLIIDGESAEARKKDILAKEDEVESIKSSEADENTLNYEEVVTDDQINETLKINVAFKTIQIMGQILRNYTGTLKGIEKLEVAQNSYSLGFRSLKFMYNALEVTQSEIVTFLADLLYEKHPKWNAEQVRNRVSSMIFYMSEGLSFVLTKHIADSLGHEDLSMVFDELLEKNPTNLSYQFVDLIIRLYHFKGFPEKEIFDLYRKVRKSPFTAQLVRHIVWYYFYIYPVDESLLQRVCEKLEIEIQPTLRDSRPKLLKG